MTASKVEVTTLGPKVTGSKPVTTDLVTATKLLAEMINRDSLEKSAGSRTQLVCMCDEEIIVQAGQKKVFFRMAGSGTHGIMKLRKVALVYVLALQYEYPSVFICGTLKDWRNRSYPTALIEGVHSLAVELGFSRADQTKVRNSLGRL